MSTAVAACPDKKAREITDQLKSHLTISASLLLQALKLRVWEPLGYASWESYRDAELLPDRQLKAPKSRELVAALTSGDKPMSNRATAKAIGVPESTVRNELRAIESTQSCAVKPQVEVVETGVIDAEPKVTGADGKSFRAQGHYGGRTPLVDPFENHIKTLIKTSRNLIKITDKSTFGNVRQGLNAGQGASLKRVVTVLQTVLEALEGSVEGKFGTR